MRNPHELFKTLEDRWDWDKYTQQCDLIALSVLNRQRAKDSFAYLRGIFGEGFLRRAERERNPIFLWYFADWSPSARLALIMLVESLQSLEGATNFRSALKDIKRRLIAKDARERLNEKLSMVRIASKFSDAGFHVEFDPRVRVINESGHIAPKIPDLKITDRAAGQDIIVELSRMKASDYQRLSSRTFKVIWSILIDEGMHNDPEALKDIVGSRYVLPYAVIHRGLEDDELHDVVERTRRLIEHVRVSGEFAELIVPDAIEIGVASYDNHHLANEWAAKRGITQTERVRGVSIQSDELARAKTKLRTELRQIPAETPGIIMIEASENLLFFVYNLAALATYLGEELKRYPKLLWAVFFHSFGMGGNESYVKAIGPHTFVNQVRSDGSTDQFLILRNVAANPVSAATLQKLESAFAVR